MSSYGKVAYDAYCEDTGGVSLVTGDKLPRHADLPVEIRRAWDAAAEAVLDSYTGEDDDWYDDYDDLDNDDDDEDYDEEWDDED